MSWQDVHSSSDMPGLWRALKQGCCISLQRGSQKRWRSSPCAKGGALADAARSKCMRVEPLPSLNGSNAAAAPEEQAQRFGVFAGLCFVFWVTAFSNTLKNGCAVQPSLHIL